MSLIAELEKLIQVAQRAEIRYVDSRGNISERKIDPKVLYFNLEEDWVLLAFCHKRQAERSFRLKKIKELKSIEEFFPPPSSVLYRYFHS